MPEPVLPLRLFRNRVFATTVGRRLRRRLRDVRLDHLPAAVPAGRARARRPPSPGLQMLPMMLGLLHHVDRQRAAHQPDRPVQGVPDRRHRGLHDRACTCCPCMGRDTTGAAVRPRPCSCSAPASAWSCRCSCSRCRTRSSTATWAPAPAARRSSARSAAASASPCSARCSARTWRSTLRERRRRRTRSGPCSADVLTRSTAGPPRAAPPVVQDWFLDGYADSIHTIFLLRPSRSGVLAFAPGLAHPRAAAAHRRQQPRAGRGLRRAGGPLVATRSCGSCCGARSAARTRCAAYAILNRDLDIDLTPGQCWMLSRVSGERSRTFDAMTERSGVELDRVRAVAAELESRGLIEVHDDDGHPHPGGRRGRRAAARERARPAARDRRAVGRRRAGARGARRAGHRPAAAAGPVVGGAAA